jgi:AraC-like DNA-binding protein
VLTSEPLVAADGVTVATVRCRHAGVAWSAAEPVERFGLVLVRSGVFRLEVDGAEQVADVCAGYVQRLGTEQRVAHPAGDDVCTSFALTPEQLDALTAGVAPAGPVLTSPQVDLAHRMLVARARSGADPGELAERAVVITGAALSQLAPVAAGFPSRRRARLVADDVREAVAADPAVGLSELARLTGLSTYHVSRVFRRQSGLTVTGYRARLKVRRALERLADGQRDLALLAVESGFADQAHLTRTVRRETGRTPGELRRDLTP